jgi:hypothetical protein
MDTPFLTKLAMPEDYETAGYRADDLGDPDLGLFVGTEEADADQPAIAAPLLFSPLFGRSVGR